MNKLRRVAECGRHEPSPPVELRHHYRSPRPSLVEAATHFSPIPFRLVQRHMIAAMSAPFPHMLVILYRRVKA